MKNYKIGLLGFGTIGAGVVEGIERNGALIASRTDIQLSLNMLSDLDLDTDRGVTVERERMTTDSLKVIESPDTDIVVELIGGTGIARELILRALSLGKPVVTANKALLAEHGEEIYRTAHENNTDVFYEGSVGGGIPVIRALREGLVANEIERIYGILNGTCNYILTSMEQDGVPFDQVLAEAQAEGFAEANPGLDIDGIDTSHKAVILAALAYGKQVPLSMVTIRGIRGLEITDIQYAAELGYRIKLLAVLKHEDGEVEIGVYPALVPLDHLLASVNGVFNAVMVSGDVVGDTLYYGRGAGRKPTASAVLGDIVDAARNLAFSSPRRVPAFTEHTHYERVRPHEDIRTRYYLRVSLLDKPGMIARVAGILGAQEISIASIIQKECDLGCHAPVIILTHTAQERQFQAALEQIDALKEVDRPTVRLRIEDFK
ncbi:MAG: homoserine dehydrogenase [Kiritimatiellae bacterium]|nr:homoserine dehydrogenase [Kiritimatiellia bacterium]